MLLSFITTIIAITAFFSFSLGLLVYLSNSRSLSNRLFFLLCILSIIWNFTNYLTDTSGSPIILEASYATGALMLGVGLMWATVFEAKEETKFKLLPIFIFSFLVFILSFIPNFLLMFDDKGFIFSTRPRIGFYLYAVYYLCTSTLIIRTIFRKYLVYGRPTRLRYVLLGTIVTLFTTVFSSIFFPIVSSKILFGSIDSLGFLFFSFFVAYSIIKHGLFNIKVIIIELLLFLLWIFLLIRIILITDLSEKMGTIFIFIVTIIIGLMFIRSVLQSISQREQINELTRNFDQM